MPSLIPLRPATGTYPGPPLIGPSPGGLVPLPYAEHAHRVEARWRPVHSWRERIDGKQEAMWKGYPTRAYRPRFQFGWNHLDQASASTLASLLTAGGALWFAPYSDGVVAPQPQAFEVTLLSEVPDFDDLVTLRRPISVELEGVRVVTLVQL